MALNLTITPQSGSGNATVSVAGNANTGRYSRSKSITIQGAGVAAKTVTVNQLGKTEFITIGEAMTVAASATSLTIKGKSNAESLSVNIPVDKIGLSGYTQYYVSNTSYNSGSAINGDPGASEQYDWEVRLTFEKNTTIDARQATIEVTTKNGESATVTITQSAGDAYLNVAPTTLQMAADGTAVQFSIESNTSWSIS